MRVLVACEYSGVVRDAFRQRGHDAYSCDIIDSEVPSKYHIKDDVKNVISGFFDLMIAHPPCTDIAVSGARHFKEKIADGRQQAAIEFVLFLMNAPIERICIENPVSVISTKIRKPDQVIQPYHFGHGECKKTCLWLKNLPKLNHTNVVDGREQRIWKMPPSKDRWKERSRTYTGIAEAMASQWG